MILSAKTDIGLYRDSNQDSFATGSFVSGDAWAIVCDGMGGVSGGQVASSLCIQKASAVIKRGYRADMTISSAKNLIESAVNAANITVYEESLKEPELHGMGTTIVVAIVINNIAVIGYVGDSRAYLISDGIKPITKDHSLVQVMIDTGKLTSEEAKTHPDRNIITRAVGIMNNVDIDIEIVDFKDEDKILLCTDGLNGSVEDEEIFNIINLYGSDATEKLVEAAIKNGSRDNITAVLFDSLIQGE